MKLEKLKKRIFKELKNLLKIMKNLLIKFYQVLSLKQL